MAAEEKSPKAAGGPRPETATDAEKPRGGKEHVDFKDLDPEIARTMLMTRHLIIGVGGVGKEALLAIAYGMRERDMQFGVPDIERRVVVDALAIDGDDSTFDSAKHEDARILEESGVIGCHLYVADQDAEFRSHGIEKNITPGFPDEEDAQGCNANPKVGLGRYAIARQRKIRDENGDLVNPKAAIEEMVAAWKAPDREKPQPRRAKTIHVHVVGGQAGGTGPLSAAVMADATNSLRNVFGSEHVISPRLFVMSGEPFGITGTPGVQSTRDFNSFVNTLYLNRQIFDGGVQLPDGNFVTGKPREIFVLDGQSASVSVPKEGAYEPASLMAKKILTDIAGETNGSGASALSNMRQDHLIMESPDKDETEFRPLRRFAVLGACETVPKPQRVILEREKRKDLFRGTVGLDAPNNAQQQRIIVALDGILPTNTYEQLQNAIQAPGIKTDSILVEGQESRAASCVDGVVRNFKAVKQPELVAVVENDLRPKVQKALLDFTGAFNGLLNEEGLETAGSLLRGLTERVDAMEITCRQKSETAVTTAQASSSGLPALVKAVKDASGNIPFFFRKNAIRTLEENVSSLVEQVNKFGEATRDYRISEAFLHLFIPALRRVLDAMSTEYNRQRNDAQQVFDGIKETYDPSKTGETEVDYRISVSSQWKENPEQLRRNNLAGYSVEDMEAFVQSIELTPEDTDLLRKFTQEMADAVGAWAQPFFRESPFYTDTKERPKGNVPIFAVPKEYVDVDQEGKITQTRIATPAGFQTAPVATSDRVLALKEIHGISPIERQYFVDTLRSFLKLSPKERERFFIQKGDMEAMLPPIAKAFAQAELDRDNRGTTKDCNSCKIIFYRPMNDTNDCCPGCRKLPSAQPSRVPSGSGGS